MDRALVTGAAGFLGRHLVHRLLERGDKVRALDISVPEDLPEGFAAGAEMTARGVRGKGWIAGDIQGAEWIAADIRDAEAVASACKGMDTVYHLASLIPQRKANIETMRAVNIGGTRNVLDAARNAGLRRVIYLSSVEIFGVPKVVPCPEDGELAPLGEYGRNKIEAENLCREACAAGLPVVMLRPPTITGSGLDEPFILSLLSAIQKGKPVTLLGKGTNRFQFIHVDDVVDACLLAAEHPDAAGEAFNIGGKDVPSIAELVHLVASAVGSPSKVKLIPTTLAKIAIALLRPFGAALLEPEHVAIAICDYVFDWSKARRILGWEPRWSVADALIDTYRAIYGG